MVKTVSILSLALVFTIFAGSLFAQSAWRAGKVECPGDLISVYFTSAGKGWVAGDSGFLASTTDGGRTWNRVDLGTDADINEIYFRNERNGYLVAGKKMFITSDAGDTWRETEIVRPGMLERGTPEFLSIRFADRRRGIIVGSVLNEDERVIDSLVLRSEDGGETWERIIVPSKAELFHLHFDGSSRAWIVGDEGMILATTNGGSTWRQQRSGTKHALYNVFFRNSRIGYVVGKGGTILRTEDGGNNWLSVANSFPETFMRVDFADANNGWIVGHNGTILRSGDQGRTWVKQESGTDRDLYGLFMVRRYGWAVGANGMVLESVR